MANRYVVYCAQPQASGPYYVGISVPWSIGKIPLNSSDNESQLQAMLGRFGISSTEVSVIVGALSQGQGMYVLSSVSIDDGTAEAFGIQLHDGNTPDEKNTVQLTPAASQASVLTVNMVLNNQIMPAPLQGCFAWTDVRGCLQASGQFTAQSLQAAEAQLRSGQAVTLPPGSGASTGLLACIGKLPAACAATAPAPPSNLSGSVQ